MKSLILLFLSTSFIFAAANTNKKETLADIELRKQMELEKKYAKEQTFYTGKAYDLKRFEVNADSIKALPAIEEDDSGDDVLDLDK